MFNFLKFLIFLIFIILVYPEESLTFSSEDQFFDFLKEWTLSDSVDGFRGFHTNFTKQLMNTSANPCEDFYNFACGNFDNVLPEDAASNYRQTTDINFYFSAKIFQKALQADPTGDESEFLLKAKNFYRSCVDDAAWLPEVARNFLTNFAKWPLLNDDWSERDFDWLNVTAHAAYYGHKGLIQHRTGYNDLLYDGFGAIWVRQLDLNDLKKSFEAFSINLDGKEDQLREVLQLYEALRNLTSDYTTLGDRKLFKLSELEEEYPSFDARRYLQIVHDREDLPSDMPVFVTATNHFRRLNELIASTDKRTIANFIFSQLTENFAPNRDRFFLSGRERSCFRLSASAFYFGLAEWFKNTYISKENAEQISKFKKTLQDVAYAHFGDKEVDRERIYTAKDHIFFPLTTNVSDFFIPKYKDVNVDPNNFYSTWLQLKRIFKLEDMNGLEPDLFFKGEYTLLRIREGLVVPVTLFLPPFFHEHAPQYFKYGTIGSYISHQFYKVLGQNKQAYRESLECLQSLGYEMPDNKTCAVTEGVALALEAYKHWLTKDGSSGEVTDIELKGRFLDGVQGLFLAYAQTVCVKRDESTKRQISQAFSEFSEFRKAYNCD